jgi:hypothetical protein
MMQKALSTKLQIVFWKDSFHSIFMILRAMDCVVSMVKDITRLWMQTK